MSQAGRFSYLSKHAAIRVDQRTRMTNQEILELLDAGAYVDIGAKPGLQKHYLLFWSPPDQKAFVALRDDSVGTVITVLPLEYNANLYRPVTDEEVEAARVKCIQRHTGQAKLELKANYLGEDGKPKAITLWKGYCPEEAEEVEALLGDRALTRDWCDAIRKARIPAEKIAALFLRKGGAKPRVDIPEHLARQLLSKINAA